MCYLPTYKSPGLPFTYRMPSGVDCLGRSIVKFDQDFVSSCIIG